MRSWRQLHPCWRQRLAKWRLWALQLKTLPRVTGADCTRHDRCVAGGALRLHLQAHIAAAALHGVLEGTPSSSACHQLSATSASPRLEDSMWAYAVCFRSLMLGARRKVDLLQGMLTALLQQEQQQGSQHLQGRPAAAVASFATTTGAKQGAGRQIEELRQQLTAAQVGIGNGTHFMVCAFKSALIHFWTLACAVCLCIESSQPARAHQRQLQPPKQVPECLSDHCLAWHAVCLLQSKLSAAEGRMAELDTQLQLLTGASGALQQQLEQQQDAAAAAATAAHQVSYC